MANTYQQYVANGATATFTIPFPFLNKNHVGVYVDGVKQLIAVHFDIPTAAQVTFRPSFVPTANAVVVVRRETPTDALVEYQNGAVLTAEELNTALKQALYGLEEIRDYQMAQIGNGLTRITDGNVVDPSVVVDALVQEVLNSTLLAELQSRIGDIDSNAEAILEQTLRVDSLLDNIDDLENGAAGYNTLITNETNERIAEDEALAETISFIGAKSPDGLSFIFDANTAKIDSTTSLATKLSAMQTTLDGNVASIIAESEARSDADSAFATSLNLLGAQIDGGSAWLLNTATVKVSPTESLATRLTALEANSGTVVTRSQTAPSSPTAGDIWVELNIDDEVVGNWRWSGTAWESIDPADIATTKAALLAEQTVRADADTALASDITTLSSTVDDNTTAIQVAATTIDGIQGKYTVKIDNNGYVTGFGLISEANNGTPTSEFIVLADRFSVVVPGQTKRVPFIVGTVNGVSMVGISGNLLVDGTIQANAIATNAITATKIAANAITADKIAANAVTAGKIAAGAITADKIAAGAVTADTLAVGTITADKIVAKAITADKINDLAVGSGQIAPGAVSVSGLYAQTLSDYDADLLCTVVGTWYDFTVSGVVDARVTLTGIPTSGARTLITVNAAARRKGSDNNRVSFRVIRDDNVVIAPSSIDNVWTTGGDETTFSWSFYDNAPASASHTYRLQLRRPSGKNPGVFTNVQLLATVLKK